MSVLRIGHAITTTIFMDKEWGLVDCISFVVMKKHGIKDALAADDHFIQAEFNALLLEK